MKTFLVKALACRYLLVEVSNDADEPDVEEQLEDTIWAPRNWDADHYKVERELTTPEEIDMARLYGAKFLKAL